MKRAKYAPSGLAFARVISVGAVMLGTAASAVAIPTGVPADYNEDGTVNAADFSIWRDHLGEAVTLSGEGPGVTPGLVTREDYDFWKNNYGRNSGIVTPEPSTLVLWLLGAFWGCLSYRRRR